MWKFTELRELYKKAGWKESNFVIRQPLSSKSSTYSVNSNTIERPMASQQADRSSSVRNLRAISTPVPLDVVSSYEQIIKKPQNEMYLLTKPHQSQTNYSSTINSNQTHDIYSTYSTVQMTALNGHVGNRKYHASVEFLHQFPDKLDPNTGLI